VRLPAHQGVDPAMQAGGDGPSAGSKGPTALCMVLARAESDGMGASGFPFADAPVPLVGGRYIDWGVVSISVTNLAIIVAMVILFVLALVLPFPHRHDDDGNGS
jgi:hypothetical protein